MRAPARRACSRMSNGQGRPVRADDSGGRHSRCRARNPSRRVPQAQMLRGSCAPKGCNAQLSGAQRSPRQEPLWSSCGPGRGGRPRTSCVSDAHPQRAIKNAAQVTAMNTTRCCIHGFNQMGTMRGTQLELGAGAAGSTVAALVQLVLLAQRSRREGSWADTTRCCHSFKRACKLHSKSAASMLPPARLCCTASSASAGVPPPLAAAATAASCCWLAAKACVAACSAATASSNSACRLRVATAPSPAAGSGAGSGPPPEAHRHCAGRHAAGCRAALRSRTCHRGRTQA